MRIDQRDMRCNVFGVVAYESKWSFQIKLNETNVSNKKAICILYIIYRYISIRQTKSLISF